MGGGGGYNNQSNPYGGSTPYGTGGVVSGGSTRSTSSYAPPPGAGTPMVQPNATMPQTANMMAGYMTQPRMTGMEGPAQSKQFQTGTWDTALPQASAAPSVQYGMTSGAALRPNKIQGPVARDAGGGQGDGGMSKASFGYTTGQPTAAGNPWAAQAAAGWASGPTGGGMGSSRPMTSSELTTMNAYRGLSPQQQMSQFGSAGAAAGFSSPLGGGKDGSGNPVKPSPLGGNYSTGRPTGGIGYY